MVKPKTILRILTMIIKRPSEVLSYWKTLRVLPQFHVISKRPLPIFIHHSAKISKHPTASLKVRKLFWVGRFNTQIGQNGQETLDRCVIQLGSHSNLDIDGNVIIGPGVR